MSISHLIRLEGLAKTYNLTDGQQLHAVRDVSLQVLEGEIFGLIGTSGAGKSTLLRLINLLERPDAGRVFVGERELSALSKRELRDARRGIGMIFQQFNLLQNASVADNVAFPLKLNGGLTKDQVAQRVRDCLTLVGIADKADSHPAQLSGGQKQRVAIARALTTRPRLLLCDEPTSALDAETTGALLDTLREINRQLGVTIVIVTHELSVVQRLCHRVAVIEDGAVAEQFAVGAVGSARRTALGRTLSRLAAFDDSLGAGLREAQHA
ncbi:ATP-binding cassette domain-containing protein [Piscinibacter sp. XHJ-5]|uniref:methionine ABC transporter ATP-binding protein n=1 Tax=Piscinibacter sp. XHJ-5 TaxID=3037797 RepID=UPI0024531381|nr:ATP-binding cassette domain-containing protein [Piscinibacter sp. XHJ-5]